MGFHSVLNGFFLSIFRIVHQVSFPLALNRAVIVSRQHCQKRKTKPTHTFSSARTVQEDRNIARELEGVRKRVRQFERVFFLCANINLFNLQVFIIYLVRCYIL